MVGNYLGITPTQELPKIIATSSGTRSITAIRNYFCDEQILRVFVQTLVSVIVNSSAKITSSS